MGWEKAHLSFQLRWAKIYENYHYTSDVVDILKIVWFMVFHVFKGMTLLNKPESQAPNGNLHKVRLKLHLAYVLRWNLFNYLG